MLLSKNKKNNVYPCEPQFYCIKVGFKGTELYRYVFVMIFFPFRFLRRELLCRKVKVKITSAVSFVAKWREFTVNIQVSKIHIKPFMPSGFFYYNSLDRFHDFLYKGSG